MSCEIVEKSRNFNSKGTFCSFGLRLIPPVFEFSNPSSGVTYEKSMKFINISKQPIRLQFKKRIDNKLFELRAPHEQIVLASGLSTSITLSFKCVNDTEEYKSCVTVHVSEEPFVIPILVQSAKPSMDVTRFLDFGNVIADGRVVFRTLAVSNWGESEGNCKIKYEGLCPIKIHHHHVNVLSNEMKEIKVELRATQPMKLNDFITVKLDGRSTLQVQIFGEIIEPSLQLLTESSREPLKCIYFGSVYYGSMAVQSAILFNNSPEPTSFITILDDSKISTTDVETSQYEGHLAHPTTMFSVIPSEGNLQAYESLKINFKFSPNFISSKRGWNCLEKFRQPPRKDYTVYVTIESVDVSGTLLKPDKKHVCVEIGCIASVHPLDICFHPTRVHFEVDKGGDVAHKRIKLTNMSAVLPIDFDVKTAPFIRISPNNGNLTPHQSIEFNVAIRPRNYGRIKTYIPIEILGSPGGSVISTVYLECHGFVHKLEQYTKHPVKFNPGITPRITNEVGLGTDVTFDDRIEKPYQTMLGSEKTDVHQHKEGRNKNSALIAFPNERPRSVRPYSRTKECRTIFTRVKRYNYVDPAYQHSRRRVKEISASRGKIIKEVRDQGSEKRKKKEIQRELKGMTISDLGMISQCGLECKEPSWQSEIDINCKDIFKQRDVNNSLLTKPNLIREREDIAKQPVLGGLKAYPESAKEKSDCKLKLSPTELYMVFISPGYLDFGDVCENSTNPTVLKAMNCLQTHIFLSFEVTSSEIKFGCPLSMVIPPKSHTEIPLDFEPIHLEDFHRSIKYTINQQHERHVVLAAKVVKQHLILRPEHLTIEPYLTRNAADGYHGTVSLSNPLNHPAKFEWKLLDDSCAEVESAFHIYPTSGVVDAYCCIDCEVIYFLAKTGYETKFLLNVRGGLDSILECNVQMDPAKVVAIDENIAFGPIAFHLPVERTCILRNASFCHAAFQVATNLQIPAPSVSPSKGVLSAFDLKELKLKLCPDVMGKLDQRVAIAVKNGKTIELKLNGQVEPPLIEMNQSVFNFRAVPCGSLKTMPFIISNKGKTKAEIEFDLRGYIDFSVIFHRQKGISNNPTQFSSKEIPGIYRTQILSGEAINVEICFHPVELVAHDFSLPLDINKISTFANYDKKTSVVKLTATSKKAETQKISNKGPSEHYSVKKSITPYEITLPYYHISAVATPQVILLEPSCLSLTVRRKQKIGARLTGSTAVCELVNMSDKPISWLLNVNQSTPPIIDPIFLFGLTDEKPVDKTNIGGELSAGASCQIHVWFNPDVAGGLYRCKIPVTIKTLPHPVAFLSLEGIYRIPRIIFNPPEIILPIVPLNITVHAQFYLNAFDHDQFAIDSVQYPTLTYSRIESMWNHPTLEVTFPEGKVLKVDPVDQKSCLPFLLTFRSPRPIFFSQKLTFVSCDGNSFSVPISGGSENCFLSTHALLQNWRSSAQIVLPPETLTDENSEPMMVQCSINTPTTNKSLSTDSTFDLAKSEYLSSVADTVTITSFDMLTPSSYYNSNDQVHIEEHLASLSDSAETWATLRCATQDPLTTVMERWFSVHGFPGGVYPIRIPDSLTRALFCTQMQESRTLKLAPLSKLYSTIFDSIHSLTGRTVLANIKLTLSTDPVERANQLYSQLDCLIRFLQAQIGCTVGSKPEYMLTYKDYLIWLRHRNERNTLLVVPCVPEMDHETFREQSTKIWTEYLLQIYKTLVLYRISFITYPSFEIFKRDGSSKTIALSGLSSFGSNLYSVSERIVLIWLNCVYESELDYLREITIGDKPTKRWIVNFDTDLMDSLPFAALFSAYCSVSVENELSGMYGKPVTQEQMRHNATRIIMALEELGKEYDIKAVDIMKPHPVAMLMFCVFLFERLPTLVTRSSIVLKGELHTPVSKQITLTNPGTKMIGYRTVVSGPGKKNYSSTHVTFTIPPNGKFSFNIECKNKSLTPEKAVLQLQAKKIGPATGISLMFSLEAVITNAAPIETINIESPCYEQKLKNIKIKNYFNEKGTFSLTLHECVDTGGQEFYHPNETDGCDELIRFFFCNKSSVKLDPKDAEDIQVSFTPLLISKRHCYLVFSNPKIGDFVYCIIGEVLPPMQMPYKGDFDLITGINIGEKYLKNSDGVIYVNGSVGEECLIELPIPFENSVLMSALVQAAQTYIASDEYKRLRDTDTLKTTSLIDMLSSLLYKYSLKVDGVQENNPDEKIFKVEIDCDQFLVSPIFRIVAHDLNQPCPQSTHPRCKVKYDARNMPNILTIKIKPLIHGYYVSRLVLKNPRDVRVYQIQLCANSTEPLALLDFSTAAHQAIAQDIPLVNTTNFDWRLAVEIDGRGFSGPQKLDVPAYSTQNYTLIFWPMKESIVEGLLKFVNIKDGMAYHFSLLGRALHPFPFASHSFSCMARQLIRREIEVPNITLRKFTFLVESDLPFVSGPSSISVPPLCKGVYPLEIYCLSSGQFMGTLSFRVVTTEKVKDSDGEITLDDDYDKEEWVGYVVWASLNITASPAAAEKTITITCNLLESTVLETLIKNPTKDAMAISVEIVGEGLSGVDMLNIQPGKKETYRLNYTPIRIGSADGRLIFCHPEVGEFWYNLKLQALPPLPTYLADIECQLGKTALESLLVKNCCNEQVLVDVSCSDTLNFSIGDGETVMTLLPNAEAAIQYRFIPSGIQRFKNKFTFQSKQLGEVVFYVQGIGLYPTDIIDINIITPLGMTNSYTINFLNPTMFDAYGKIIFKEPGRDKMESCFSIPLENMEGIFLRGRVEFQIPIFFRARHMREYKAILLVTLQRADKKLWLFLDQDKEQPKEVVWTYHIYGIPEYIIDRKQRILRCQAKKTLYEYITLNLHHCVPPISTQGIQLGGERFTYQIQASGKDNLVKTFTKVSLEKECWDCKSNVAELNFRIDFTPLMTMKANAPFTIRSAAGGIWKLPLLFIATEPDPDNLLVIKAIDQDPRENYAEINIRSPNDLSMAFHAYFLPRSDNDFRVYPEMGLLPSRKSEAMKIIVTYTPKNYVKVSRAKLMIQGDECEWLYDIQGIPPQYRPPNTFSVSRMPSKTTLFGWK